MKIVKGNKNTHKKIKLQMLGLFAVVALAGGSIYGSVYLGEQVEAKASIEGTYNQLRGDISQQQGISKGLSEQIDATGKSLSGTFMSKDEFIAFMGATAQRIGVSLNKYTGGDTEVKDGIATMNFKFEAEGTLGQLEDLVKSVDLLGTPYAINSISTRKADNYVWLDRDVSKLEILPWWDEKSIEIKKPYTEVEDPEPIGIADIMGSKVLKMYLDVSFISSENNPDGEALPEFDTEADIPTIGGGTPSIGEASIPEVDVTEESEDSNTGESSSISG